MPMFCQRTFLSLMYHVNQLWWNSPAPIVIAKHDFLPEVRDMLTGTVNSPETVDGGTEFAGLQLKSC